MDGSAICWAAGAFFGSVSAVGAIREGRAGAALWGHVRRRTRARGPGAFREADLTEERPRRVPLAVWVAGIGGRAALWVGLAAGLPAMLRLAFRSVSDPFDSHPVLCAFVVLASLVMLILTAALGAVATALQRCKLGAGPRAQWVGGLSLAWSLGLALVLGYDGFGSALMGEVGLLAAAVASLGVATAWAGHVVSRTQEGMSDEEWLALPRE